jgi:hypothetical protein
MDAAKSSPADKNADLLTDYMSEPELADGLGEHIRTTQRRRASGSGPPYLILARQILYRRDAVIAWLLAQELQSTNKSSASPVRRRRRLARAETGTARG